MRPSLSPFARRLIGLALLADALVVALHVLNELGGWEKRLFDLTEEQNLPTWLNSVQFAGAALAAALAAEVARRRLAWRALAAILLFFSLDELALVHEEIIERVADESGGEPWFWPFFYTPIAAACLAAVVVAARDARRALGSVWLFLAGFGCLGVALVLDGAAAEYMDEPWLWQPSVVVEESLELLGPVLLAVVGLAVWENRAASASTFSRE
ncbi:MAG: hypothetical protein ACRDOP_05675 [Gaiellaceae bacterium]